MKYIPEAVSRRVGRSLLTISKHSPTLLFGVGVVGVVATTVLASKATLHLEDALDETICDIDRAKLSRETHSDSYSDKEYTQDLAVIYARGAVAVSRLYAPAIAVGTLSIACLTGSHVILTNRNLGLTAAYAAIEKGFAEYRKRVIEEYGEEKDLECRYGIAEYMTTRETSNGVVANVTRGPEDRSIYARFFDQCSPSWDKVPEYNVIFVKCQERYMNDLLRARGHVFLNEVYDSLGLERSRAGAVVGWLVDGAGDNYIDFGLYDDRPGCRDFVNGREGSIFLDFNVDGTIHDKI